MSKSDRLKEIERIVRELAKLRLRVQDNSARTHSASDSIRMQCEKIREDAIEEHLEIVQ